MEISEERRRKVVEEEGKKKKKRLEIYNVHWRDRGYIAHLHRQCAYIRVVAKGGSRTERWSITQCFIKW